MELILFFVTAFAGFAGGCIILARSLSAPGRMIAAGLFSIALWQCGAFAYSLWHVPWAILFFLLAELGAVSAFFLSLCSMEGHLAQQRVLIQWIKTIVTFICLFYVISLLLLPNLYVGSSSLGFVVDILGIAQAILVLVGVISCLWIMENIIRSATIENRRILMYPLLGIMVICASLLINVIYRIGTRSINEDMLVLSSLIMILGVSLVVFFSIRHRLFSMDIYVSRYIVYHSVTFICIGIYLLANGIIIFIIQRLALHPSFVVMGFLIFCAVLIFLVLIISPTLRTHIRFFINTHFLANKYDYRKEWGELSCYLCSATTEKQIIHITAQVILESMYIRELSLWLRDGNFFHCAFAFPHSPHVDYVAIDHPFIAYITARPFMRSLPAVADDSLWERIITADATFLEANKIELAIPMTNDKTMIGFIAVGQEYLGTHYTQDDIDLLNNIAAQCGTSLMQARFAQKLAENKEIDTYNYLSASLLHDLKNAAGHLSLLLQNAPQHMDHKDFQQDMLETISQALARIDKVINKLRGLPNKAEIAYQAIEVKSFVNSQLNKFKPRLATVRLTQHIQDGIMVTTDFDLLERMLENLVINAIEAVSPLGEIMITATLSNGATSITIADDGPGIADEFMRNMMFKPFQTTKPAGTGLGLWQVKNMAQQLGARIMINNRHPHGLACTMIFPADNRSSEKDLGLS